MASPTQIFLDIVARFEAEQLSEEQLHDELDALEHFVAVHQDRLSELSLSDQGEETVLLRETATTCFAAFFEAIELVRQHAHERQASGLSLAKDLCRDAGVHIQHLMELQN